MIWTRRRVLQAGGALAGASAAAVFSRPAAAVDKTDRRAPTPASAKRVSLLNLHTNERLELEFFRGDSYVKDSLSAIQVLLRDFRNGEQHPIDPLVMDYLFDVATSRASRWNGDDESPRSSKVHSTIATSGRRNVAGQIHFGPVSAP